MQSIIGQTTRKPDLIFHPNGCIDITANVVKALGIKPGNTIDIMHGDGEWLLYVRYRGEKIGRHDGTVFRSNKGGNHCRAYSKKLSTAILDYCNRSDSVKLPVGTPIKIPTYGLALPIIIKNQLP